MLSLKKLSKRTVSMQITTRLRGAGGMDGWQDVNKKLKGSKSHDRYVLTIGRMILFNCDGLETKVGRMVPYRPP
jgi:hypothetical protein